MDEIVSVDCKETTIHGCHDCPSGIGVNCSKTGKNILAHKSEKRYHELCPHVGE